MQCYCKFSARFLHKMFTVPENILGKEGYCDAMYSYGGPGAKFLCTSLFLWPNILLQEEYFIYLLLVSYRFI